MGENDNDVVLSIILDEVRRLRNVNKELNDKINSQQIQISELIKQLHKK